ncbi:MAG: hypothetical protein E6649_15985 [Paeniclostridium sordellii]|nr:hypothetical protein [Paeniclostridium sordellii]
MGISRIEMYLDLERDTDDIDEKLKYLRSALSDAKMIKHKVYINIISSKICNLESEDSKEKPLFKSISKEKF